MFDGTYADSDPSGAYPGSEGSGPVPGSEGSGIFPGSETAPTIEPFPAATGTVDRLPVSDIQACGLTPQTACLNAYRCATLQCVQPFIECAYIG